MPSERFAWWTVPDPGHFPPWLPPPIFVRVNGRPPTERWNDPEFRRRPHP